MPWRGVGVALLVGALLAGCAGVPVPEPVDDPDAVWQERRSHLLTLTGWDATARLAIDAGKDGGTVSLVWRQRADRYHMRFSGFLGQGVMQLRGEPGMVRLRTADGTVHIASEPESLLVDALGWSVPLSGLRYWIAGRDQPGVPVDVLELDPAGRPLRIEQSGWRIEYQDFESHGQYLLPTRMTLANDRLSARVVIKRWDIEPAQALP